MVIAPVLTAYAISEWIRWSVLYHHQRGSVITHHKGHILFEPATTLAQIIHERQRDQQIHGSGKSKAGTERELETGVFRYFSIQRKLDNDLPKVRHGHGRHSKYQVCTSALMWLRVD